MTRLRDTDTVLPNFLASGALALGRKLGPILWLAATQLPLRRRGARAVLRSVYVRLHGHDELYVSGHTDEGLDMWAKKIRKWRKNYDVNVYSTTTPRSLLPATRWHCSGG